MPPDNERCVAVRCKNPLLSCRIQQTKKQTRIHTELGLFCTESIDFSRLIRVANVVKSCVNLLLIHLGKVTGCKPHKAVDYEESEAYPYEAVEVTVPLKHISAYRHSSIQQEAMEHYSDNQLLNGELVKII